MNFEQSPAFKKDLKKLQKRWRSLPGDLTAAERIITDVYTDTEQQELFQQQFFDGKRATRLTVTETSEVVKMRLDVSDLGTRDKVRVIFVAVRRHNQVIFVELYAKNEKSREDPDRYEPYM